MRLTECMRVNVFLFFPLPFFPFQLDAKKGLECTRGDLEHVQLVLASVVSEASTGSDPDALAMRQRVVLLGAQHTSMCYGSTIYVSEFYYMTPVHLPCANASAS